MKKSYFYLVILALGMFVLGVVFSGVGIDMYVYLPAFIVVVLPPAFLSAAAFGLSSCIRSFHVAFDSVPATPGELRVGIQFFNGLRRSLLLTGLVTMMIGIIAVLATRDVDDGIGPLVAIALITLLYALVFIFAVVVPFRSALEKRLIQAEEASVAREGHV